MFPLESVLVPGMVLPLQVFEDRYRQLVKDCLAGDEEFGVVLIERGSEVGGNDQRSDFGTVARIARSAELEDGRWAVVAVGVRRIRVVQWLDDAPYPRAHVEDWPDDEVPGDQIAATYEAGVGALRQVLAMAAELGESAAPSTVELSDDPHLGSHQLAALAPIGPLDRQQLLGAPDAGARLALLGRLLADEATVLRARLSAG
jgi:Lon protease-like protein